MDWTPERLKRRATELRANSQKHADLADMMLKQAIEYESISGDWQAQIDKLDPPDGGTVVTRPYTVSPTWRNAIDCRLEDDCK